MRSILFFIMLMSSFSLQGKALILTFHYNLPELIEIQHKTLKKFLKENYELIVFNDAREEEHEKGIQAVCDKFKIRCIRFQPEWHETDPFNTLISNWNQDRSLHSHIGTLYPQHPSVRHCHVIQYALDQFGYDNNGPVMLLDGDCFPTRPVSLKQLLGNNHIVATSKEEGGYEYLWVVFSLFNPKTVPHKDDLKFHLDIIDGQIHDTGSHTYNYLKNHPEVICKKIKKENSAGFYSWADNELREYGFNKNEIILMRDLDALKNFPWPITVEFHINKGFIHLGNSSSTLPGRREKLDCIKQFINRILKTKKSLYTE